MTTLPIVERELRLASRCRGTYRSRYLAAIVAVVLALLTLYYTQGGPRPAGNGHTLLTTLAALLFVYTGLAGTQLTCDTLSRERRDGTLGLLFLTDLRPYDVVLGKLVAGSLNGGYGMLAVLPVLAFSLVLGGTTNGEFWRVALVSANLLFLFCAAGIFSSAICRRDQNAPVVAFALALALVLAGPLLHRLRDPLSSSPLLQAASPAYGCFTAFDIPYTANAAEFWANAALTNLYGWIFLTLAFLTIQRTWQDEPVGPKSGRLADLLRGVMEGSAASRRVSRNNLLQLNPYLWRASRSRGRRIQRWLALGLIAAGWYAAGLVFHLPLFDDTKNVVAAVLLHFVLKLWVAGEAFRCFAEDRRSGGMELVLMTPLSGPEIVRGQRRALWRQFAAPAVVVLVVDFLFMALALRHAHTVEKGREWIGFYAASAVYLVLDMSSLGWIGMRVGMSSRQPYRTVILWYGGLVAISSLLTLLDAACFSISGDMGTICFTAFMVAGPATFHLMYSSVPQLALQKRFLEIARQSYGENPALSEYVDSIEGPLEFAGESCGETIAAPPAP